jgi:hypothetical protein
MFRSLSRVTVAVAFVLALVLSTVPVQAQPRDLGSILTSDASWLDAALGWLGGLFGGGEAEPIQTMTTGGKKGAGSLPGGGFGTMSGTCIDPSGICGDNG